MRTNIEIDPDLMRTALEVSGLKTERAVVEESLRLLIKLRRQGEVAALFGKLPWDGDLNETRLGNE